VRSDSAGWSHYFVDHCGECKVWFVIGHALTVDIAKTLVKVPKRKWQPAVSPVGSERRYHGEIIEITDWSICRAGQTAIGWLCAARLRTLGYNSPSPRSSATHCKCSSPITPTPDFPKRSTADAAEPNDKPATPKPPDSPTCHRTRARSTKPGSSAA
jgi:hypothetical protein